MVSTEVDLNGCIFPSYWAGYLSKVAEVTLLPIDYIWHKLPYAQGLQYMMEWYYRHEMVCKSIGAKIAGTVNLSQPL